MTEQDTISLLLRSAGHRPVPPRETEEAVYLGATVAWRHTVRRRRMRLALAAAATLACVAVGVAWLASFVPTEEMTVATVVRASGCARIDSPSTLATRDRLELASGCGIALLTPEQRRMRLVGPAQAQFTGERTLRLTSGKLYFDSGRPDAHIPAFTIETAYGGVTHAGTQFAVAVSNADLTVMVRSGAARVATSSMLIGVGRGEAVRIDTDGRETARWPFATSGPEWAWADALAPALELEGRSLAEVLVDIARETGRQVAYENEDVRALCRSTRLHGPALALPPDRMLDAVLASTELDGHIEGDRLLIRRRAPG